MLIFHVKIDQIGDRTQRVAAGGDPAGVGLGAAVALDDADEGIGSRTSAGVAALDDAHVSAQARGGAGLVVDTHMCGDVAHPAGDAIVIGQAHDVAQILRGLRRYIPAR